MIKFRKNGVCGMLFVLALSVVLGVGGCGGGRISTSESFRIEPYIQQLKPTEVTVKWQTSLDAAAETRYKKSGDWLWMSKTAEAGVVLHEARLENLRPGAEYKFFVDIKGGASMLAQPKSVTFRTPVLKPDEVTFAVYGDTRSHPDDHEKVVSAMVGKFSGKLDFCLHTGDLVDDGRKAEQWPREFFGPAEKLMSRVALYPVLGNHEHDSKLYFEFFTLPGNERWYSFDFGDVHVTCLDSYSDLRPGSAQYDWLVNDLAGSAARWKVAAFHAPIYSSGPHGKLNPLGTPVEKAIAHIQKHILPIFEKYNVTMTFNGHDHLYERSKKGNFYFVTAGGGGAPLHKVKRNEKQNPYSNVVMNIHHYCVVRADENEFTMTAYDSNNAVIDQVKIKASDY